MMKAIASFLIVLTLFSTRAAGQDLGKLQGRVQGLWDALTANEPLRALENVEEASQARFLERKPSNVMTAFLVGLEFTEDPDTVSAQVRTTVMLGQLGPTEMIRSDVWVWDGQDWFLRVPEGIPVTPFGRTAASTERLPEGKRDNLPRDNSPRIEFLVDVLDLGSHVQGDQVQGSVPFRVLGGSIRSIRTSDALGSVPGLSFDDPEWVVDGESGRLPYTWDTTLVSTAAEALIVFSVRDRGSKRALFPLMIVGAIEPRIRFTQVPDVVDMSEAGSFELIVENISHQPFGIWSTSSANSDYKFDADWPDTFLPGMSGKVVVSYPAKQAPTRISVMLTFRGLVLGQRRLTLKPVLVETEKRGPTAEEREELMRSIKAAQPPGPPPER